MRDYRLAGPGGIGRASQGERPLAGPPARPAIAIPPRRAGRRDNAATFADIG